VHTCVHLFGGKFCIVGRPRGGDFFIFLCFLLDVEADQMFMCGYNTMLVHWKESYWYWLREFVRENTGVRRYLAACGLLKLFDYPLI
jgi:hypothetical protein